MTEDDSPELPEESNELENPNEPQEQFPPPIPADAEPQPEPQRLEYGFSFTGTTGEYFRIWIVNLFLTIITLGIFLAWAKVRQRKYLYGNTWLDADNFGFHGRPFAILTGYIIIFIGLLIYSQGGYINPYLPVWIFVIYLLLYPFLAFKAIRFRARYSSFRNIRFHFKGELPVAYQRYLAWSLLIPLTMGLIIPYIAFLKKDYLLNFMFFGNRPLWFTGRAGKFYPPYIIGGAIMFGGYILAMIVAFLIILPTFTTMGEGQFGTVVFYLITILTYAVILFSYSCGQSVIFPMIQNYAWQETKMGGSISFRSDYRIGDYMALQLTNLAAIVFSLGFAIPWATIRKTRFIMENLYVIADHGKLDEVLEGMSTEEAAVGEAAADYLDFDIGL